MSVRRKWTVVEDAVLKMLKEQRKVNKWNSIAKIMSQQFEISGRCGKHCRQRYNNHLVGSINEGRLTDQQQNKLIESHEKYGNKWQLIATLFQNRTANFLKNQIYSKFRKLLRKLNRWIKKIPHLKNKQFRLGLVYKIVEANDYKFTENKFSSEELKFFTFKEQFFVVLKQINLKPHKLEYFGYDFVQADDRISIRISVLRLIGHIQKQKRRQKSHQHSQSQAKNNDMGQDQQQQDQFVNEMKQQMQMEVSALQKQEPNMWLCSDIFNVLQLKQSQIQLKENQINQNSLQLLQNYNQRFQISSGQSYKNNGKQYESQYFQLINKKNLEKCIDFQQTLGQ